MQKPQLIQLPKFLDERGNLSFFENENQIPFIIRRVHWIYDVPGAKNVEDWRIRQQRSSSSPCLVPLM